jgi:hypothetical protein
MKGEGQPGVLGQQVCTAASGSYWLGDGFGFLGRRQYPPSCVTHAAQLPDVLFRRRGDGMRTLGLR